MAAAASAQAASAALETGASVGGIGSACGDVGVCDGGGAGCFTRGACGGVAGGPSRFFSAISALVVESKPDVGLFTAPFWYLPRDGGGRRPSVSESGASHPASCYLRPAAALRRSL